jgi:hypothetical protein
MLNLTRVWMGVILAVMSATICLLFVCPTAILGVCLLIRSLCLMLNIFVLQWLKIN